MYMPVAADSAYTELLYYYEYSNGGGCIVCSRLAGNVLSVTVTLGATPLPAALPLFATGLAGLGLLGWRRKRRRSRPNNSGGLGLSRRSARFFRSGAVILSLMLE
jgi:hypothetical protein